MRPGPGLVVMALAFISGARRGSTSTSSKISSSSTSPSSPSPHVLSASEVGLSVSPSSIFLPYSSSAPTQQQRNRNLNKGPYLLNEYKYPFSIFLLPKHLRRIYDKTHDRSSTFPPTTRSLSRSIRKRRRRRARSTNIVVSSGPNTNNAGTSSSRSKFGHIDEDENISESTAERDGLGVTGATDIDDHINENFAIDSSGNGDSEGLFVRYPKNSVETSRSFDEDDILALVAEDDLLSEESFDRLIKFTDDKISDINEEYYGGTEGGTDSGGSESYFADAAESQQQRKDENDHIHHADNANISRQGEKAGGVDNHGGEIAYMANLITNNNNKIAAIAEKSQVVSIDEESSLGGVSPTESRQTYNIWSIFESESPLTRLNPWISACDLAQPGTAPDLQGQCSAGTLPVAWVDEGPGPPACPKSCEQLRINNTDNFNANTYNNNVNNIKNRNNSPYIKPSNFQNNIYVGKMSKTRRDFDEQRSGSGSTPSKDLRQKEPILSYTSTSIKQADNRMPLAYNPESRQPPSDKNNVVKMSATRSGAKNSNSNNNSKSPKFGSDNSNNLPEDKQEQQRKQHTHESKHHPQEEQQCLDYLGDTKETSPVHLCTYTYKKPGQLMERLRSLRLRNCCERNVYSALHTMALNATLGGGVPCVRVLMDLMDLDLLGSRITCELAEILFRFDCRQVYSLIHQCDDCKEAYRRWVCSTLVPYFAEQDDIIAPVDKNTNTNAKSSFITSTQTAITIAKEASIPPFSASNLIFDTVRHLNAAEEDTGSGSNNSNNTNLNIATEIQTEELRFKRYLNTLSKLNTEDSLPDIERHRYHNNSTPNDNLATAPASKSTTPRHNDGLASNTEYIANVETGGGQQPQSFVSTANNVDPSERDPVISKLNKRSKRKVEFRKRRRIRPCLSVCQTVEQKCPYLLPADRAPALPTQYAGEPTFLCLDQNIPETGEQLRKSSYGPPDCCYAYCGNVADGICARCNKFTLEFPTEDKPVAAVGQTRRSHNITMVATSHHRLNARLETTINDTTSKRTASVFIALSHENATTALENQALERLPYFAFCEGTYYYDDDIADMPEEAISDDCPPVPSVTSRCSIPYYASSATARRQSSRGKIFNQHVLLLLSVLLCLLSSHTAVLQLQHRRLHTIYASSIAMNANFSAQHSSRWRTRHPGRSTPARTRARSRFGPNTNKHDASINSGAPCTHRHGLRGCRGSSDSLRLRERLKLKLKGNEINEPCSRQSRRSTMKCDGGSKYMKLLSKYVHDMKNICRLNRKEYFSSNIKAYRSKDCSKFINCYNIINAKTHNDKLIEIGTEDPKCSNHKNKPNNKNNNKGNNKNKNNMIYNYNKIQFHITQTSCNKDKMINENLKRCNDEQRSQCNEQNLNTKRIFNSYYNCYKRKVNNKTKRMHCRAAKTETKNNNTSYDTYNNNYDRKYRFIFYYNFNVSDWWRRWWRRRRMRAEIRKKSSHPES